MRKFTLSQYIEEYTGDSNKIILDTYNWNYDLWSTNKEPNIDYKTNFLDFLLKKQTFIDSNDFSKYEIENLISIKEEIVIYNEDDVGPELKEINYHLLINLKNLFYLIKEKEKKYMKNYISNSEYLDFDNFKKIINNITSQSFNNDELNSETISGTNKNSNFYSLIEVIEFFADGMSLSEFKEEIMPMIKIIVSKTSDYYGEYYETKVFQKINLKKLYQKLIDLNYIKEPILIKTVNI